MPVRGCKTCMKRWKQRCGVLKEPIGLREECWAWTDDPDWWRKVQAAMARYKEGYIIKEETNAAHTKRIKDTGEKISER